MNNINDGLKFLKYAGDCQSTNELARELVQQNQLQHGAAIYTDRQQAGKGQRGRSWFEEAGLNLALSMVLKEVPRSLQSPAKLNVIIASAVHRVLSPMANVKIKWPNDIFYKDSKVAGILTEASWQGDRAEFFIVGVGVNVNNEKFPPFCPPATSLKRILGKHTDISMLAARLRKEILECLEAKSLSQHQKYYHTHLYARAIYRVFYDPLKGKYMPAAIAGIDEEARLLLFHPEKKIQAFGHGEIEFRFERWSEKKGSDK